MISSSFINSFAFGLLNIESVQVQVEKNATSRPSLIIFFSVSRKSRALYRAPPEPVAV